MKIEYPLWYLTPKIFRKISIINIFFEFNGCHQEGRIKKNLNLNYSKTAPRNFKWIWPFNQARRGLFGTICRFSPTFSAYNDSGIGWVIWIHFSFVIDFFDLMRIWWQKCQNISRNICTWCEHWHCRWCCPMSAHVYMHMWKCQLNLFGNRFVKPFRKILHIKHRALEIR